MIKTIAIIILSVTFFGVLFFILVRNALKKKIDILVEEEKKRKNQIILINLLNSVFSKSKTLFDNSKEKPPLARIPISFL